MSAFCEHHKLKETCLDCQADQRFQEWRQSRDVEIAALRAENAKLREIAGELGKVLRMAQHVIRQHSSQIGIMKLDTTLARWTEIEGGKG